MSTKLERYVPQEFLNVTGKNLPALYKAFNEGAGNIDQLVQAAIDQLFLTTASGRYLIKLGEEGGFTLPTQTGLDINAYKLLAPVMVSAPKQVRITLEELIGVFYEQTRTNAVSTSTAFEPYALLDGDSISVETDGGLVSVTITAADVADLSVVTAGEIASFINNAQDLVSAGVFTDRINNKSYVTLTSKSAGSGSFVRIAGGTLQNVLRFPKLPDALVPSGAVFDLTKIESYSDELTFTWDGVSTQPTLHNVEIGDVVTIRGLVDGSADFSLLNGSYTVEDVGYDYFKIKSTFPEVAETLTITDDYEIVFTSQSPTILTDNTEYAYVSEISPQTINITVPVIPPIARRSLEGSAHVRGYVHPVTDFTRSTITVSATSTQPIPVGVNSIVLAGDYLRYDSAHSYPTTDVSASLTLPVYTLDTTTNVMPYTTFTFLSTDAIHGKVGSNKYTIAFPFPHGMRTGWEMTLAGFTGSENATALLINIPIIVGKIIDDNTIEVSLYDGGLPLNYDGIAFGPADVYRHSSVQANTADFYIDFTTGAAAIASGLTAGTVFRFDTSGGTDVSPYYGQALRYRDLYVVEVIGQYVHFASGLNIGPQGLVMSSVSGRRSAHFGGSLGTYKFDKTTSNNLAILNNLNAHFRVNSGSLNSEFVGPYIYDTNGSSSLTVTVSKHVALLTDAIFKGETTRVLQVDASNVGDDVPDSGRLVIGYGTSKQEGPLSYTTYRPNGSNTQVIVDPSYRFKFTHDIGTNIVVAHNFAIYDPVLDGSDYPFYLTGTSAARNSLFKFIKLLVSAGIFIETEVIAPDLRYDDSEIDVFA